MPERFSAAACDGHLDAVKVFGTHGAQVDTKNREGNTALHLAADAGHARVITWLLDHGADVNAKNEQWTTPLLRAAQGGQCQCR